MTAPTPSSEAKRIQELAEKYVRAGYEVIDRPPFSLTGYQPDLVVRKGDQGLIIESKSSAARMPVERLQKLAADISCHEGWRFLLVTSEDVISQELPGNDLQTLSWTDVNSEIEQAQRLESSGDHTAAYLILWIAFERMLRLHAIQLHLPIERLFPSVVIKHLYSMGELSMEQYDVALACQQTRNTVVHGLDSPELADSYRKLEQLVRGLSAEWADAPALAAG